MPPVAVTAFVGNGWMLPPVDCYIFCCCHCSVISCHFCYCQFIVAISVSAGAVAFFVAAIDCWHFSTPVAIAAFVCAGWMLPPVNCCL